MSNWEQRTVPWNGVGVDISASANVVEAMRLANIDWEVKTQPIVDIFGNEISGYNEVMRMDNHEALGVVKGRYTTIQNADAFSFVDYMDGATLDKAGSYHGGEMT